MYGMKANKEQVIDILIVGTQQPLVNVLVL
jgi:hypothetical protein